MSCGEEEGCTARLG